MKANHTPGPWMVESRYGDVLDSNGKTVRVYGMALTGSEEAKANSYLVAAAPDLLEALRWLLRVHAVPSSVCSERPAYEYSLSAIAKATGQKP